VLQKVRERYRRIVVEVDSTSYGDELLAPRVGMDDWAHFSKTLLSLSFGGNLAVE
jgi:hypothetical protein